jgi:hypothetical protein
MHAMGRPSMVAICLGRPHRPLLAGGCCSGVCRMLPCGSSLSTARSSPSCMGGN